jgi:hypothetical protein
MRALRRLIAWLRGTHAVSAVARELTVAERALLTRRALAASCAAFERDRVRVVLSVRK